MVSESKAAISSLKIRFNSSVPRYLYLETRASIRSIIFKVVLTPTSLVTKTSSRLSKTPSSTLDFPATAFPNLLKKLDLDFFDIDQLIEAKQDMKISKFLKIRVKNFLEY